MAARATAAPVPLGQRLVGLGSVFGKTIRDSRRATLIVAGFLALFAVVAGAATAFAFDTPESRREVALLATTLPAIFQGLLGRPIGLETLGGIIEWRYAPLFLLLVPLWSILALSSTLAAEARNGSLDLVVSTPSSRRRVALEKLAGHVAVVVLAMAVLALATWLVGIVFETLPGDAIPFEAAVAYAALVGLTTLAMGSVAFSLAGFFGRGVAVAITGAVMTFMFFVNGFRSSVEVFETLSALSWYRWTYEHVPLAELYDWPSLVPLAVAFVVFAGVGVIAFERRDLGSVVPIRLPRTPRPLLGLGGPFGRSLSEQLNGTVAWGLGIALYAAVIVSTGSAFAESIRNVPAIDALLRAIFPTIDYGTVAGLLQLVFVEFGLIMFGFVAASTVAGWASEETHGRLEMVLSAPLSRVAWVLRSGLGVHLAIALAAALVAAGIGLATVGLGEDPLTPMAGTFVVAFYGAAWAGVGMAVGGLVRPSLAAPVVVALTVGTFLLALIAPAFDLPEWVSDLALTAHYGQPMVGEWDLVGIAASLALAFGGLAVAAWGMSRRDLRV